MAEEMTVERSSKDYYGKQNIRITIGQEQAEIPIEILENFIENENIQKSFIPILD